MLIKNRRILVKLAVFVKNVDFTGFKSLLKLYGLIFEYKKRTLIGSKTLFYRNKKRIFLFVFM